MSDTGTPEIPTSWKDFQMVRSAFHVAKHRAQSFKGVVVLQIAAHDQLAKIEHEALLGNEFNGRATG